MANLNNQPSFNIEPEQKAKGGISSVYEKIKKFREGNLIFIILLVSIIMSFLSPHFLTWDNIKAILMSFSTEGIVVIGQTLIIIVGGIDLSVGAVMCLASVIAGKLFLIGVNPWIASLIAIIATGILGAIGGYFVTRIGLSHFIVTLGMMQVARGACFVITKGTPLSLFELPKSFKYIGQGTILGIPFIIVVFAIIVIISDYMLRNSTAMRKIFFTGSNEKAAIFSGLNVNKIKIWVGVITSALAGFAGILLMVRFGAATANAGVGLELTAIAAAVIGGASLTGGKGTVLGSILGIMLLSTVTGSMVLLDVSPYWQDLIKGLILLAAVSYDHLRERANK